MEKEIDTRAISAQESDGFFILKAFAIVCVIAAHVVTFIDKGHGHYNYIVSSLWQMMARLGVPAFMILSGFFYGRKAGDTKTFWKKKAISIVLPWLVATVFAFAIAFAMGARDNIVISFLLRFVGYGSSFYYLTVLCVFFALFKLLPHNNAVLFTSIALSLVSLTLETFDVNIISNLMDNSYLNVFNWIGFFAFGIVCRKYRLDRKIGQSVTALIVLSITAVVGAVLFFVFEITTYFHIFSVVYEIAFVGLLFMLSNLISRTKASKVFVEIGKWSYCIYLFHMPIVQPICSRLPYVLMVIKPFIALAIMCAIIFVGNYICKKLKLNFVLSMVGLR